jgi:hypothetical protein
VLGGTQRGEGGRVCRMGRQDEEERPERAVHPWSAEPTRSKSARGDNRVAIERHGPLCYSRWSGAAQAAVGSPHP